MGGDPINSVDPLGLTACDIEIARRVVERRMTNGVSNFKDYRTPAFPGNMGQRDPNTDIISLSAKFDAALPNVQFPDYTLDALLDTIIHEMGHRAGWPAQNVPGPNFPASDHNFEFAEKVRTIKEQLSPIFESEQRRYCVPAQ